MTTVWREKLAALSADLTFAPAASEGAVRDCERELGLELPEQLRELLLESDGIQGEYGLGLVWPVLQIRDDNRHFRSSPDFRELYMPFDPLLFFGDAGNGDQFAYAINDGLVRRDDIFAWIHEDDSRTWVAPSLDRYFEWWLEGRINL
jgi:hypothetical protein